MALAKQTVAVFGGKSLLLLGALVAACLTCVVLIPMRGHCGVWHGPEPTLEIHIIRWAQWTITLTYFGIPITLAMISWRAYRATPRAMIDLSTWFVAFIAVCGTTHMARAVARPVVYCVEDLIILSLAAIVSTGAFARAIWTMPAIMKIFELLRLLPQFRQLLETESPVELSAVLSVVIEQVRKEQAARAEGPT